MYKSNKDKKFSKIIYTTFLNYKFKLYFPQLNHIKTYDIPNKEVKTFDKK